MKPLRRKYLINKPFQLGYTANMLLLQLLGFTTSAGVVAWIFLVVLNRRLTHSLDQTFLLQFGSIVTVLIIGTVFWTIRYSHTIAGPIYKSRQVLKEVADGRLPVMPVVFRKRDAFKPLADDLTNMIQVVHAERLRFALVKVELEALEEMLGSDKVDTGECRDIIRELLLRISKL